MTQVKSKLACYRSEVPTKTQGEIQAAICNGIANFEQDYIGREPKAIHAHLIGDRRRGHALYVGRGARLQATQETAESRIRPGLVVVVSRGVHGGIL